MIRDITLGQSFPGNSLLHRLDPRTKIILTVLYITAVFLAKSVTAFALITLFTLTLLFISTVPPATVFRSLRAVIFIIVFTALFGIFRSTGDSVIFEWWIFRMTVEGLMFSLMMIIRIVCLLCGTSVILTYTTTPIALTDGLERLLSPLKALHLPVHEFSMMMTIALRFIPTLIEETDKIMSAQKSRGADFSSGNLISRCKALIPIIIPLFISAFRRADELATAMECRCYRGGEGRTRMTERHLTPLDFVTLALFGVIIAAVILLNRHFPFYLVK